jgi:hypothetical protein
VLVLRDGNQVGREEFPGCIKEQVEPGLSLIECPDFKSVCELSELGSLKNIFKFRSGTWDTTRDLVASYS